MKITYLFSLIMTAILGLAVGVPQNSQASERSKKEGDCVTCKRPVYSYRHLKTYSRGKPVYTWKVSGHGTCQPISNGAELVKNEGEGMSADSKAGKGKKAEAKKMARHQAVKKQPESKNKNKSEPESYAQHGGQQAPQAYGGGSGYGGKNYGAGYGGQGYGNSFHSGYERNLGYGCRERVYGGSEFGYGYGNGTVTRRTTVTRSTPSTLGSVGGGFSGTSTRTYTTRTRTNYRGSYGRIWGGSTYRSRPHVSRY